MDSIVVLRDGDSSAASVQPETAQGLSGFNPLTDVSAARGVALHTLSDQYHAQIGAMDLSFVDVVAEDGGAVEVKGSEEVVYT
jgi:hypothetical protein